MPVPLRAIAIAAAALLYLSVPAAVEAGYVSTLAGGTATMTGDSNSDTLIITQQPDGLFHHNRKAAGDSGFNSDIDFDTGTLGDQTLASATGIININARDGDDVIALGDGVNIRGTINGENGTDTLDLSAYATAVSANLGLRPTALNATIGADQQVPITTPTGTATAAITNYNITAHTFDINVTVTGLPPGDVTGFHIHQALAGVNGPIIVDFNGLALLVPSGGGTGFTFTATACCSRPSRSSVPGGGTLRQHPYRGVPERRHPRSALSEGNEPLGSGVATGVASVTNIENLRGGGGNDSLVGSSLANTISGNAGADWILGGPGDDTLNGDAGADVLIWSNGDGTDVVNGGADIDTVVVNGNTTAGDAFTVSPGGGGRLTFARTNLVPFSLDIGTAEALTIDGIGGADAVTINDLTGVATLATMNLNGFDGNDVFTFNSTSANSLVFNVNGGTGTDTLQGPNGLNTWNVTAPGQGNIAGLVGAFSSIETLSGGSASDIFNVKAFTTGALTVTGGAGSDTLNYDAESRTVSGDIEPPDGFINSPPVQPVTFFQIEAVTIINPQPLMTISDVNVAEGGAPLNAVFNVILSNTSQLPVTSVSQPPTARRRPPPTTPHRVDR